MKVAVAKAQSIGMEIQRETVIGETLAMPAQMIMAPATGESDLPMPPESTVMAPIFIISSPNCVAWALTALLNAIEAASPEPERTATKKGPTTDAAFAIIGDPDI